MIDKAGASFQCFLTFDAAAAADNKMNRVKQAGKRGDFLRLAIPLGVRTRSSLKDTDTNWLCVMMMTPGRHRPAAAAKRIDRLLLLLPPLFVARFFLSLFSAFFVVVIVIVAATVACCVCLLLPLILFSICPLLLFSSPFAHCLSQWAIFGQVQVCPLKECCCFC